MENQGGKTMFSKLPENHPTISWWTDLLLNKMSTFSLTNLAVLTRNQCNFPSTPYKATKMTEVLELVGTLTSASGHVVALESDWWNPLKVQDQAFLSCGMTLAITALLKYMIMYYKTFAFKSLCNKRLELIPDFGNINNWILVSRTISTLLLLFYALI